MCGQGRPFHPCGQAMLRFINRRLANGSHHTGPLPATPRFIATLTLHSRRALIASLSVFVVAAFGSLFVFWPILVEEDFQEYLRSDGPQHANHEAYHQAKKLAGEVMKVRVAGGVPPRLLDDTGPHQPERSSMRFFIKLIYATVNGSNIFVPERLAEIRDIEFRLATTLPSYRQFCGAGWQPDGCQKPVSVINYFYATQDRSSGDLIFDGNGASLMPVQAILASMGTQNAWFLDRHFGVSKNQLQDFLAGNITRSVFRFGVPLRGFINREDRPGLQEAKFRTFVANELFPFLDSASTKEMRVHFYGEVLTSYEITRTVWHDSAYALGSLAFVFCYLVFHLRSGILAVAALVCIALSFPLSYGIYSLVVGHHRMIAINFLSLFVVLGVGADDVFVLNDLWRNSRMHGTGEIALARRLWLMYTKAGAAIFATSATTAASFFANIASSIGPLRQFGFFMGTCITMNWLVVATVYPLVLVVYERRSCSAGGGTFLSAPQSGGTEMEEQLVPCNMEEEEEEERRAGLEEEVTRHNFRDGCQPLASGTVGTVGAAPPVRRSLGSKALIHVGCLAGLLIPLGAIVVATRQLRPASGLPQFFPKDSNLGALQDLQKRFGNETAIGHMDLRVCGGVVRKASVCQKIAEEAASQKESSPLNENQVTQAPSPQRPSREKEFAVKLVVKDHTAGELAAMRGTFEAALIRKFGLHSGDVVIDVGDGAASSRRLVGEERGPQTVTVHFHHLSQQQEELVSRYVNEHQDLLSSLGGQAFIPAGQWPPHLQPGSVPSTLTPAPASLPPTPVLRDHVVPTSPAVTARTVSSTPPSFQSWSQWRPVLAASKATTPVLHQTTSPSPEQTAPSPAPAVAMVLPTTTQEPPPSVAPLSATIAPPTTLAANTVASWPGVPTTAAAHGLPVETTMAGVIVDATTAGMLVGMDTIAPGMVTAIDTTTVGTMPGMDTTTPRMDAGMDTTVAGMVTGMDTTMPAMLAAIDTTAVGTIPGRDTSPSTSPPTVMPTVPATPPTVPARQPWPSSKVPPKEPPEVPPIAPPTASPTVLPTAPLTVVATPSPTAPPTVLPTALPTLPATRPTVPALPPAKAMPHAKPRSPAQTTLPEAGGHMWHMPAMNAATTEKMWGRSHQPWTPIVQATAASTTPWLAPPVAQAPTGAVAVPKMKVRGMAYDRTATVAIVWGVVPDLLDGRSFDARPPEAQLALKGMCDRVVAEKSLKVFQSRCWPQEFASFLESSGMSFPSRNLASDLSRWSVVNRHVFGNYIGLGEHGWNPLWVSVDFRVEFDTHSSGRQSKPYMKAWQEFIDKQNRNAGGAKSLGSAIVSTDLFVRTEAELRIVGSALSSWLVSVACALAAVVAFTRSAFLSVAATFAIFGTAACSLFTITSVFQWHFGLMEAVSLIVFCGFSVDYPLHVVQAYVQERRHGAGIRQALLEVGFAVASGCATTVGAASFLLLCQISIFTRFGQVLMANMLFSLVFALVWIPALLEWRELCGLGPKKQVV